LGFVCPPPPGQPPLRKRSCGFRRRAIAGSGHHLRVPTASSFPSALPVARRCDLYDLGISDKRIRTALRVGRWQEPVRGVVVPHAGALTQRERWLVALAYAGPESCLSHHSALMLWGARAEELAAGRRVAGVLGDYTPLPEGGMVEVSRAHGQHMSSHGFVVVHQSRRPLEAVELSGLCATSAARAVVDVAMTARRRADVEHAVSDALQRGLTTVDELVEETRKAGRRASSWLRVAVADARRGMRSVGESDLRRVIIRAGLPEPEWNAPVETAIGTFFVDALWRKRRVAAEADGMAYHLSARDWSADLRRQNALHGVGLVLLRFPVQRLRYDEDACGEEIGRLVA
jgi:very-short-patch-repair endonuclease